MPAFRLARLAVDLRVQGQVRGEQPLLSAGKRCLVRPRKLAVSAVLIDAKNARAAAILPLVWRGLFNMVDDQHIDSRFSRL